MFTPFSCEENTRTPILEERVCPQCGAEVEVFTVRGRLNDDYTCECGYVFQKEEQVVTIPKPREN